VKLREIILELGLKVRSGADKYGTVVKGGYVSDLMSDVIANSEEGDIWVTLQTHQNIVAIASLRNLAGIILIKGREPEDETLEKAKAEGVPIMVSDLSAFALVGRLYDLGVSGREKTSKM